MIDFMKKAILFMILVICVLSVKAQEDKTKLISGYVTDEETGERLSGVHIRVGYKNNTITNSYGYYSIQVQEEIVQFFASYIGYSAFEER